MILRHLSRQRSCVSVSYRFGAFRRPFQTGRPAWTKAGDAPLRPLTIVKVARGIGERFLAIVVGAAIVCVIDSWDDILDGICRVVPPKTVARSASSSVPNTVYSPIHQDPPARQPITRFDEFRVLVVEPGSGTEAVRCRLVNVAKSWRTRYDALSYTWGDENVQDILLVDGLRTSVTTNLRSALTHLRHPDRERMLWVDALCVNQDDPKERDEQVSKMGSIYSNARRVVVWLGEQTEDVEGAFPTLERVANLTRFLFNREEDLTSELLSMDWSPVLSLLRRPWFQRTWIIQEAVLGREPVLACGPKTLPWKVLSDSCNSEAFQNSLPDDGPEVTQALRAVDLITHGRHECHTTFVYRRKRPGQKRATKEKYKPDFKLISTLYETRGFQCKYTQDRVFGVLSLASDVGSEDNVLGPNYRATVEEVFETVARWDIEKHQSLESLSYCSRKASMHPDIPSWAPDFSDIDDAHAISFLQKAKAQKARKRGSETVQQISNPGFGDGNGPTFVQENDKTVLVLSGMMVDTITSLGAVAENSRMVLETHTKDKDQSLSRLDMVEVSQRRAWLEECVRVALTVDPVSRNRLGSAVNFWKSPTLGVSPAHWNAFYSALTLGNLSQRYFDIRAYAHFLFEGMDANADWYQEWKTKPDYKIGDRHFRKVVHKRRFCATGTGRMGWVPGATREGDLVCLISGAQVPIILRRVLRDGKTPRYMVVGDAFFDGLMMSSWGTRTYYVGGERLSIV